MNIFEVTTFSTKHIFDELSYIDLLQPPSPDVIRRFRATVRPDAGEMRIFYGKASDPHLVWAKNMSHGITTQPSYFAKDLCNPRPKSLFQQGTIDRKEAHYASHIVAPLGRSHNQAAGLPKHLNPVEFTFGIPTELGKFHNGNITKTCPCNIQRFFQL